MISQDRDELHGETPRGGPFPARPAVRIIDESVDQALRRRDMAPRTARPPSISGKAAGTGTTERP